MGVQIEGFSSPGRRICRKVTEVDYHCVFTRVFPNDPATAVLLAGEWEHQNLGVGLASRPHGFRIYSITSTTRPQQRVVRSRIQEYLSDDTLICPD